MAVSFNFYNLCEILLLSLLLAPVPPSWLFFIDCLTSLSSFLSPNSYNLLSIKIVYLLIWVFPPAFWPFLWISFFVLALLFYIYVWIFQFFPFIDIIFILSSWVWSHQHSSVFISTLRFQSLCFFYLYFFSELFRKKLPNIRRLLIFFFFFCSLLYWLFLWIFFFVFALLLSSLHLHICLNFSIIYSCSINIIIMCDLNKIPTFRGILFYKYYFYFFLLKLSRSEINADKFIKQESIKIDVF